MFSLAPEEGVDIVFLTIEQIDYFHELALKEGGLAGNLKTDDLKSAIGRPMTAHHFGGICDLLNLAARYWHGISIAHGYCDANKRTAFISAIAFLEANGIEIDESVSSGEPGRFIEEQFQAGTFTVEVLEQYLRTRCRWIEE
ncbi:Fic family protein [Leisingera daeponensis]|uniref:Fic family protein n=1 Tax=Leisingera daeponensis TaxID=405746 RepID=A0ABS7NIW1_9RHOB|nr:Fic family protein [Leisingera daeponensis]MBY6141136.1 Fic family protein [Leisingera daeponensis]